jgi:ArsR family transcriptional regulator
MELSDKKKFNKDDARLAKVTKALAHPARIAIIRHLATMKTCCFSEISQVLPLADSTISQHLSELKSAGLVHGSFEPPRIKYSINSEGWKEARKLLKEIIRIKPEKATKE